MQFQCFRRLLASVSSLVIAVMLPVSSMTASANTDSSVKFAVDKSYVQAGDTVKLSINVDNVPAEGWNLLEFTVGFDKNQLEPVMVKNEKGEMKEWSAGPAMNLKNAITEVNAVLNPMQGASISSEGQKNNGEVLSMLFKVKDGVKAGDKLTITNTLKGLCKSVIVNGVPTQMVDLAKPGVSNLELTVQPQSWDSELTFTADKTTVQAGDTVKLSVNVDNVPVAGWNVMDLKISYDENQLEPVMNGTGSGNEWLPGPAMDNSQQTEVNININPILVASVSSKGQTLNGEYMSILFKVKDGVKTGDTLTISGKVKQFAKAVIVDGKAQLPQDLVQPGMVQDVDLTVQPKVLETIEVATPPTKQVYLEGKDELDVTGGKLALIYNYGDVEEIDLTTDMVTGFDNTVVGDKTLTVTYEGKTTTFDVTIKAKSLTSIEISKPAGKLKYLEGQPLDLTGLEVTAHYDNDTSKVVGVTTDMVSGFDKAVLGKQTVTITYEEKEAEFTVKVIGLGDIDEDGKISAADALQALQAATKKIILSGVNLEAAEVSGSQGVSASDSLLILQYATKKITSFSVQK